MATLSDCSLCELYLLSQESECAGTPDLIKYFVNPLILIMMMQFYIWFEWYDCHL